jgi:hypothetical protein
MLITPGPLNEWEYNVIYTGTRTYEPRYKALETTPKTLNRSLDDRHITGNLFSGMMYTFCLQLRLDCRVMFTGLYCLERRVEAYSCRFG